MWGGTKMTNVWWIFIIISSCHYQTFDTLVIITQVQYFYKWIKIDVTSVFEVHYHEISVKTCKIHNQMQYFILYLNAKSWSDYVERHIIWKIFLVWINLRTSCCSATYKLLNHNECIMCKMCLRHKNNDWKKSGSGNL